MSLTAQRARETLDYNPLTGAFAWKDAKKNRRGVCGTVSEYGYVRIKIDGRTQRAHRVAWLIVHGEWPTEMIDHVNGDRADNRLCNLRIATRSQNLANARRYVTNTTGHKGITWRKDRQRWNVRIMANDKTHYVGLFEDFDAAVAAHRAAMRAIHGEYGRSS